MSRYFVIAYRRSLGRLLEVAEFDRDDAAFAKRLALDLEHRLDPDVEIALLAANSLEEVKKTHSRYFKTLSEMAAKG